MSVIVDKKLLVELRKKTYAGFSDCKKALEATNNNIEEATVWLRKNGIAKANSKFADKSAEDGKVFVKMDANGAVIFEVNSETDFTANSKPFVDLLEKIANFVLKEKSDDKLSEVSEIKDELLNLSAITGEKIVLKRVKYVSKLESETITVYQHHNQKIATIVKVNTNVDNESIKPLAVHLAANNPQFLKPEDVSKEWIEKEKAVSFEIFRKENKPEELMERIVESKIKKTIEENSFITQPFLFDAKKTVKDFLKSFNTDLVHAIYFEVGK